MKYVMPVENVGEIRPLLGQVTVQRAVTYHSDDGTVAVQIAQTFAARTLSPSSDYQTEMTHLIGSHTDLN